MDELGVWDVLDEFQLNPKRSDPLACLGPDVVGFLVVNTWDHFGYSTELFWLVHAEEEVDLGVLDGFDVTRSLVRIVITFVFQIFQIQIRSVKYFISTFGWAPELVLNGFVDISYYSV